MDRLAGSAVGQGEEGAAGEAAAGEEEPEAEGQDLSGGGIIRDAGRRGSTRSAPGLRERAPPEVRPQLKSAGARLSQLGERPRGAIPTRPRGLAQGIESRGGLTAIPLCRVFSPMKRARSTS
jgi:hypothetical protein